jgi:hypothetical protein
MTSTSKAGRTPPTLVQARSLIDGCRTIGDVLGQGHHWVQRTYLPALRRLAKARNRADRRTGAHGYELLGGLQDLNGAPRAAIRAYQRSLQLQPKSARPWRFIACMLENLGHFQRARHALLRAEAFNPDDGLVTADLERIDWALYHPCPVLFEEGSVPLEVSEAIAAGRYTKAHELLGRKRSIRARQLRARIHGARGEVDDVVRQWTIIANGKGRVHPQHADWFYAFQGPAGDDPRLWRVLLWKIRPKLDGGSFNYSETLWDIDVPMAKRFELHSRCELARCEGDVEALLALAAKYPTWREPGQLALKLGDSTKVAFLRGRKA